jgi:hypothetical protein
MLGVNHREIVLDILNSAGGVLIPRREGNEELGWSWSRGVEFQ